MQFVTLAAAAAGAATVLFPLLTQAIQLTNDAYTGIEAGKTFDLSWSGDGSVCLSLIPFLARDVTLPHSFFVFQIHSFFDNRPRYFPSNNSCVYEKRKVHVVTNEFGL